MRAFSALLTLALTPVAWAQTAPYTVGTTAGDDWATVSTAVAWLGTQGSWNGEILIQIRPGTYPGIVTLTVPAAGGGPVRFARFGTSGTVNIGHASMASQPGGFRVYGWDGVTFEDLTVNAYGIHTFEFGDSVPGSGNPATNCVVRRCTIKLNTGSAAIGYNDERDDWAYYQGAAAVRGHWGDSVAVDRCAINVSSSNASVHNKGIWVSTNCTVTNCTITGSGVGADDGIFLSGGSLGVPALVSNCVVSKCDYRSIHCDSGDSLTGYCTLYGNSTSPTSILFSHGSSGKSEVRNCIFYNDSTVTGHYCVWTSYDGDFQTVGTLDSDHNLFYAPKGAYCGYARTTADEDGDGMEENVDDWNAGKRVDLEAWRSATGQDVHSRFGNPNFVSAGSNFRLKDDSPSQGWATPAISVAVDIENKPRNPVTPDVGAYENLNPGPGEPMSGAILVTGGGANLQTAIRDLTRRGISGPVVIDVSGETYTAVAWDAIPGVDSTNTVLLQTFEGGATIQNPTGTALRLFCADHVGIVGFHIVSTNGYAVELPRGSRNVAMWENSMSASRTSGNNRSVIFNEAASSLTNCVIEKNVIAMTVSSSGSEHYAIRNLADMTLTGNTITLTATGGGNNKAVLSTNFLDMRANFVVGVSAQAKDGLYLNGVWPVASWPGASPSGAARAENNLIRGFSYRQVWASGTAEFLHNTLVHTSTSVAGRVAEVAGGSNTRWRNNILSLAGTSSSAYCFYRNNAATVDSDYNDLYRTGSARTGYWGSARTTLANWQTASGQDLHSLAANPNFTADCHLFAPSPCQDAGTATVGIGDDVDGWGTRTDGMPDLGADEMQ